MATFPPEGKFRHETEFNAKWMLLQIAAVQVGYYLSVGLLFFLICVCYRNLKNFSFGYFVNYHMLDDLGIAFDAINQNVAPLIYILSALVGGFISGYLLMVIVGRTLKCPDFCLTAFCIHLSITWLWSGSFPVSAIWWMTTLFSFLVMLLSGIWFCSREELLPIQLPTTTKPATS